MIPVTAPILLSLPLHRRRAAGFLNSANPAIGRTGGHVAKEFRENIIYENHAQLLVGNTSLKMDVMSFRLRQRRSELQSNCPIRSLPTPPTLCEAKYGR